MVRKLFTCLLTGLMVSLVISCDKMDENDKLDGFWQMTSWVEKETGDTVATRYDSKIFYTIQLELLRMQDLTTPSGPMYQSYFHYTKDSLFIERTFVRPFDEEMPLDSLAQFGSTPDGRFGIDLLTRSQMVLSNSMNILSFRKY